MQTALLVFIMLHMHEKKETDRIALMAKELTKLGVAVQEYDDGLLISPNTHRALLSGAVDSYHDHRIAMAFAIGAIQANGDISINNADAASVTFPSFFEMLQHTGVTIQ